jgi:hypothetical protein
VQTGAQAPFSAGSVVWRDARRRLVCTLVAKASYELAPGESAFLKDPLPIQEEDAYWDDDPQKGVRVPSDLAPFKKAAEIVIVGSAFAPAERPVPSVIARAIVGSVDKSIEAWAPRTIRRDGTVKASAPQARFSLRYEHAAGGPGTDNPAGVPSGYVDAWGRYPLPTLFPPYHALGSPTDFVPVVNFGPIAWSWPPRAGYLSEQDRAWIETAAESAMPPSFPARFFQVAPMDQWLDRALVANERIVLEALHPELPRLVTSLPAIEPRAIFADPTAKVLRMQADLLLIDTDRGVATLTYRVQIPISENGPAIKMAVVGVPMGAEPKPEVIRQIVEAVSPKSRSRTDPFMATTSVEAMPWSNKSVLPFGGPSSAPRPAGQAPSGGGLPFQGSPPAPSEARAENAAPSSTRAAPGSIPRPPVAPPPPPPAVMPPPAPPAAVAPPPPVPNPIAPIAAPPIAPPAPPVPAIVKPPLSSADDASPWGSEGSRAASKVSRSSFLPPLPKEPAPATPAPAAPRDPAPAASARDTSPRRSGDSSFDAAFSAKSASDAAAKQEQKGKESASRDPGAIKSTSRRLAVVNLLFFEAKIAPRLRSLKRFADALAQPVRSRPLQSVDAPKAEDPDRDRTDILRVLSFARPSDVGEVRRALSDSLDDFVDLDLPLALVAGELRPSFDEVELLRATISAAQPVAGTDKKILAALALGQEALAAGSATRPDTAQTLARQIEQAASSLSLPPRYVASNAERMLLEDRKYKRRTLFGAPRVRAELTFTGAEAPLLVYLPDASATSLPLLPSFPVVALCEVRAREDLVEAQPEALIAMALGRVLHSRQEG